MRRLPARKPVWFKNSTEAKHSIIHHESGKKHEKYHPIPTNQSGESAYLMRNARIRDESRFIEGCAGQGIKD
jgi:hypothetical protein